jgi:hypothetical protein
MERNIESEEFWEKELPNGIKDDLGGSNNFDIKDVIAKTYPQIKLGEVSLLKDLILVLPN